MAIDRAMVTASVRANSATARAVSARSLNVSIEKSGTDNGGSTELIFPIVTEFGISKEHIFANVFTFDETGLINGVDSSQFLAQKPGKINAVKSLNLNGTIIAIGDGWTDYQIKESGLAHYFIAYTESVIRKPVIKKGDTVATSFHDVLDFLNSIKK